MPVVRSGPGGTTVIALVGWDGDRGEGRALLQAVIDGHGRARVFLAELRDWPEHDVTGDVEALADAAWETLTSALPEAVDRDHIDWYLRHGPFSTYDQAGPESLTRVDLACQGDRWTRVGGWKAYHLLDDAEASSALDGVDDVEIALEQLTGGRRA
jgi:hypothetical protein